MKPVYSLSGRPYWKFVQVGAVLATAFLLMALFSVHTRAQSIDDLACVETLPSVVYLGEYPGTYTLPDGYSTFVVKRHNPFRFDLDAGQTSGGVTQYTTADRERVWACMGECDFTAFKYVPIDLGELGTGARIDFVVLDDDGLAQNNDQRRDWWAVDDPMQPYLIVEDQQMVEDLSFTVPFEGHWYFYAADSIGLITRCVQLPEPTPTETPTATSTPTLTPTSTVLPTNTVLPTSTPTITPMPTETPTATSTETPVATDTPTATPTATNTPVVLPTAVTATPTPIPTAVHPPTAIDLVSFTATLHGGGTVLLWETGSEVQTLGFQLWRSTTGTRTDAIQVTTTLIAAKGSANDGADYSYTDMAIQQGIHYTYWLQEVRLDGTTQDVGMVQPQFSGMLYLPLIAQ